LVYIQLIFKKGIMDNSKQLKTEDFAKLVEEKQMQYANIVFLI